MLQVTMLLASAPGQPNGSVDDRFVLTLNLTWHGEIDAAANTADPKPWIATRYVADQPIWRGEIIRLEEGWGLQGEDREDSPLWLLYGRSFRPGRYITIRTHEGADLVYRIVGVGEVDKAGQGSALDPLRAEPLEPGL